MQHITLNWKKKLGAGGKPSSWLPPGRLSEHRGWFKILGRPYAKKNNVRNFEVTRIVKKCISRAVYHTVDSVEACSWVIDRVFIDLRDSTHFSFFRQYWWPPAPHRFRTTDRFAHLSERKVAYLWYRGRSIATRRNKLAVNEHDRLLRVDSAYLSVSELAESSYAVPAYLEPSVNRQPGYHRGNSPSIAAG